MSPVDKSLIQEAIEKINLISDDIAVILVINVRERAEFDLRYDRFSILSEYFSESELDEGVNKTCKEILSSGPKAVSACKALLRNISQVFPNLEILFNKHIRWIGITHLQKFMFLAK